MLFKSRVLYTSKDAAFPNDYEDGFQVSEERGIAVIADGVSSAVFSRQWADVLTRAVVARPPDLANETAFKEWLADCRREWASMIDLRTLPWNLRARLQQVGGAFSTLLWVEFSEVVGASGNIRAQAFAVGDCSLFHLRNGVLLNAFPLTTVAQFEADPISICSVNLNRDHTLEFSLFDTLGEPGDCFVLCTDALGKWATGQYEEGKQLDWMKYWDLPHTDWLDEIRRLRESSAMRYDDTTLIIIQIEGALPFAETPTGLGGAQESDVIEFAEADSVDMSTLSGDSLCDHRHADLDDCHGNGSTEELIIASAPVGVDQSYDNFGSKTQDGLV